MINHEALRNAVLAHFLSHGTPATPAEVAEVLHAPEAGIALALRSGDVQGIDALRAGYEPSKELLRQNLAGLLRSLDRGARA